MPKTDTQREGNTERFILLLPPTLREQLKRAAQDSSRATGKKVSQNQIVRDALKNALAI